MPGRETLSHGGFEEAVGSGAGREGEVERLA